MHESCCFGDKPFPLKAAHFYWSSRSCDAFLFGKRLFSRIVNCPPARNRIFIHLYCTGTADDKKCDAAAYLFRTAISRQSAIDKTTFEKSFDRQCTFVGPSFPWVWANQAKGDVVWLSDLASSGKEAVDTEDEGDDGEEQAAPEDAVRVVSPGLNGSTSAAATGYTAMRRCELTIQPTTRFSEPEILMPVVFARPDFETAIKAAGRQHPCNVHVYVCANDAVVKSCKLACEKAHEEVFLREHRKTGVLSQAMDLQQFILTYERFG